MTALRLFLIITLLTGFLYPVCITGVAQALFHHKANGNLVTSNGKVVGSSLIGQAFESDKYFHGRPSGVGYNPMPSGGSNLSPASKKVLAQTQTGVPAELWMASGSGLDPHITPNAADYQVNRIAKARNLTSTQISMLHALIERHTEKPDLGIFGESRVNVLALNLDLDKLN